MYWIIKLYQTNLMKVQHTLVECLQGKGEEMSRPLAALLLSGLPDSNETLVTTCDAHPVDEPILEYVKSKIMDEY